MRLLEIGFVPGEPFEIIAETRPGGDPLAVRIGGSCFALRRSEVQAVMVHL
jgi:ferrous iron transport protein A